jgi:protoporphyrinogen oxidase
VTPGSIVVGAGVAGLTLAERLCASGRGPVTVLERESAPGGLARTFDLDGFLFDIGPHRFHTVDRSVLDYIGLVLGPEQTSIPRASSVYLMGRYHSWPLSLGGVFGLPPGVLMRSLPDLLHRPSGRIESFADHIISRYGLNLYRFFFEGYTAKFTGTEPGLLHVDWAAAGVNRAVIDRRVRADSLGSLARSLLLPKPVSTMFIYPSNGGIARFSSKLVERIESAGGEVRLSTEVSSLVSGEGVVRGVRLADGTVLESGSVYWSAPVSMLAPGSGLEFVSTILVCVGLRRRMSNSYQWCYFGEPDICFSRVSIPRNFSEGLVPAGADSLSVELTCREGDAGWADPQALVPRVLADLERVRAIDGRDVLFARAIRVADSYPLYTLDYRQRLSAVSLPAGAVPLGRCGTFWYNNMDHSIAQALAKAEGSDVPREFWTQPS